MPYQIKFLDAHRHPDIWDALVLSDDPHYSSALYRAFGGGILGFLEADDRPQIMQPFMRQGDNWIGNAYNFGGPIGALDQFGAEFAFTLDAWKQAEGVKERCTLNPFLDQNVQVMGRMPKTTEIVYVDLRGEIQTRATTRHCIKKACDAGVKVERVEPTIANTSIFSDIYHEAMTFKQAAPHWFYRDSFFYDVLTFLGQDKAALFLTKVGDQIESGCLLIMSPEICYYHWAATRGNHPKLGVNHCQVWDTINWARYLGFKKFHLGGGFDSLMTFKQGFSKLTLPCRSYVTHPEQVKECHDRDSGRGRIKP